MKLVEKKSFYVNASETTQKIWGYFIKKLQITFDFLKQQMPN